MSAALPSVNMDAMARMLDVSLPTLRDLIKRYGDDFPVVSRGAKGVAWQFDPDRVIAFMRAKQEEERAAQVARDEMLAQVVLPGLDPPGAELVSAQERLRTAQAMRAEDELAKTRGFLVPTSDMRQRLLVIWPELTRSILAIPAQMARQHNLPPAVERDMRNRAITALRDTHGRLIHALGAFAAPPEDPEDAEAA